ncbi:MAG TPA: peptidoglycan-binding domain-containing protein [Kofleriaceae bacterium]|nr:peptidoglycan-binding domain-containing protein [Kofleriaceae bacterium]
MQDDDDDTELVSQETKDSHPGKVHVKGKLTKRGGETVTALEALEKREPGFFPKLEQVAARLGTKVEWLLNVMMMESTLDPHKKNPKSTATGLIQFMAKTARGLGTSTAALRGMTAVQQLDWVEKYFKPFKGKLTSQAAVYAAVGSGKVGNDDRVAFRAGSKEYNANKAWDVNGDGKITQGEFGQVASRFGAGTQFTIEHSDGSTPQTQQQQQPTQQKETSSTKGPHVDVTVSDLKPIKPGHIISDSVGEGGNNHQADVGTVQEALARHGHSPGKIDHKIGPATITAIKAFQAAFMSQPDGRVDVGGSTEKHLMDAGSKTKSPTKPTVDKPESEVSANGAAQMQKLVAAASSVLSKRPLGKCYVGVKHHIANAGGYGNIHNIYADTKRFTPQGAAHDFADVVNRDPAKFGLERMSIANPYDAPEGAIIVVAAGSPGTHKPVYGDISVRGPGNEFYNDGLMGYHGPKAWPPARGGVLGVYKPK